LIIGEKCDSNGNPIHPDAPPPPDTPIENVWAPFDDEVQFRLSDFLYRKVEMSQSDIDHLMDLWALSVSSAGGNSPFSDHNHMYQAIDQIRVGGAPWQCLQTAVPQSLGSDAPEWMTRSYQVWYRNPEEVIRGILANPDFVNEFDTCPYIERDKHGKHRWSDFMSANYAWNHSVSVVESSITFTCLINFTDSGLHGRQQCQGGNVCSHYSRERQNNSVSSNWQRRVSSGVSLHWQSTQFSAARAPKWGGTDCISCYSKVYVTKSSNILLLYNLSCIADRRYDNDESFRLFKKRLYHNSLAAILRPLLSGMTTPVVRRCPDGHFRRVIYDLGPFIADYPEQVLLAVIVQGWCPKCVQSFLYSHPLLMIPNIGVHLTLKTLTPSHLVGLVGTGNNC